MNIDVVITSYNRLELLVRAVRSVLRQTKKVNIIWVVDDNSDFDGDAFWCALNNEVGCIDNVRFVINANGKGACFSRNHGAILSCADYIAYLDDDDEWLPEHVEHLYNAITVKNYVLAYSGKVIKNYASGKVRCSLHVIPEVDQFNYLIKRNYPGSTSSVLVQRNALIDVGGFDVTLPAIQDYELYIRLSDKGAFTTSKSYTLIYRDDTPSKITRDLGKSRDAYFIIVKKTSGKLKRALARTIALQNLKKSLRCFSLKYSFLFLFDYFFSKY